MESMDDLRTEFRNLTLLLCFLTAINEGRPTLRDRRAPRFWELASKDGRVIDAVTTILVCNHEVIAAAASNDGSGGLVCANDANLKDSLRDFAQASAGLGPSDVPKVAQAFAPFDSGIDVDIPYTVDEGTKDMLSITAISNPDFSDKHSDSFLPDLPNGPASILGNNFWPEVASRRLGAVEK